MRETRWGPMRFEFRIGGDNRFAVTGTPSNAPDGEVYRRTGPYRLEQDGLITPALNEGRPVHVEIRDGLLILTIDDALDFHLHGV